MEVLQWIAKYWVEWLCTLITGGVILFAKRYISMHKKVIEQEWKDKEKHMCGKIIENFDEKIHKVEQQSSEEDTRIHEELDGLHVELDDIHDDIGHLGSGILSIQGKQFKDYCERLLQTGHYIDVEEYEEFESEYEVYKSLGGNHRGDALHDRVVDKVRAQMKAENNAIHYFKEELKDEEHIE